MSESTFKLEDAPASFDLSLERKVDGDWEHLSTVGFNEDIVLKFVNFTYTPEDLEKTTLYFTDNDSEFSDLRYSLSVVSIAQDYVFKKWEVTNSADNGISNGPIINPIFEYNPYEPPVPPTPPEPPTPPTPDDPATPTS